MKDSDNKIQMPLASIVVVTFNSAAYVLETLESAKHQTYRNIELIISDDSSIDNTIGICKKWLLNNKNRFVRTKLITVEKNTGVAANCNRGIANSTSDWIKLVPATICYYPIVFRTIWIL